ncbi:MAG: hypothetical protein ACOY93_01135 [Bacillota bacterium]
MKVAMWIGLWVLMDLLAYGILFGLNQKPALHTLFLISAGNLVVLLVLEEVLRRYRREAAS